MSQTNEATMGELSGEVEMGDLTEFVDLGPGIKTEEVAWVRSKRVYRF